MRQREARGGTSSGSGWVVYSLLTAGCALFFAACGTRGSTASPATPPSHDPVATADVQRDQLAQAHSYYERGVMRLAADDTAGAIADLDYALNQAPLPTAFYARGLAYSGLGKYEQAHADFSAALALQPDYAEALLGRAAAAYASGDHLAARDDLEQLKRLNLNVALQEAAARLREQLAAES